MLPETQEKGSCRFCRETKAQCDRKKPRCGECVAKNKPCGRYDMGNIFININSTGPPPVWNRSQNAQKYLVVDWASQQVSSQPEWSQTQASPYVLQTTSHVAPTDPDLNSIPSMVELFLDLYYRRYGPEKTSMDPITMGNECGGWRSLLPFWIGQSTILDTAIRALATVFVGTQYQDQDLLEHAGNMYLHALQMVQQVLPEPNSTQRKDLLATTLVMSSTELFMSNGGGSSQLAHIEGATKLLDASKSQEYGELHLYILIQGLFEAISSRRRYTFSSPSCRSKVRQMFSCPKTNRNDLYFQWCEIILPLPNILHAADRVTNILPSSRSSTPTPMPSTNTVLDDLAALEQALLPWIEVLKTSTPGPWTYPTAQVNTDSVPFPLQFASVEACALYCLYWTSQLLILDTRDALYSRLPPSEVPEVLGPDLPTQASDYASLICRSLQFCTKNTSFASTENMLLPLLVVTNHYKAHGDEERFKWCVGAFGRIADEQKISYAVETLDVTESPVQFEVQDLSGVWNQAMG